MSEDIYGTKCLEKYLIKDVINIINSFIPISKCEICKKIFEFSYKKIYIEYDFFYKDMYYCYKCELLNILYNSLFSIDYSYYYDEIKIYDNDLFNQEFVLNLLLNISDKIISYNNESAFINYLNFIIDNNHNN